MMRTQRDQCEVCVSAAGGAIETFPGRRRHVHPPSFFSRSTSRVSDRSDRIVVSETDSAKPDFHIDVEFINRANTLS
jgi:hypothetical protein